jgi:hypothetical protein
MTTAATSTMAVQKARTKTTKIGRRNQFAFGSLSERLIGSIDVVNEEEFTGNISLIATLYE